MCRKRFLYLVLGAMVLLNAALLALAWQSVAGRRTAPDDSDSRPGATFSGTVDTALAAYERAAPVAQQWAGDAMLLRARGDWPEGSFAAQLDSWAFVFYSDQLGAIAQVHVSGDETQLLSSGPANERLAPAPLSQWQVDSDEVVATFLNGAGGELFLAERANVSMVLSLDMVDSAAWTATLIDWESGELLRRDFDAESGYLTAGL